MQFEWHEKKASQNDRKHGVTFAEAITVFADPLARVFSDPDHSDTEEREILVGYSRDNRLLVVSFVEHDDTVRIISARTATRREYLRHEENQRRK